MNNIQEQSQVLQQTQRQYQRLTQQQLMVVKLCGMSINELDNYINTEIEGNFTIEENNAASEDDQNATNDDTSIETNDEIFGEQVESPTFDPEDILYGDKDNGREQDIQIGGSTSFHDFLTSQLVNYDLSEDQQFLVEYLIGMLNDNGFLEESLDTILLDLYLDHQKNVSDKELEEALNILQQFDPPGIGAKNEQECLIIQLRRKQTESVEHNELTELAITILTDMYDLFLANNRIKLQNKYNVSKGKIDAVYNEIRKLSTRPGLALSESYSDRIATITPDFIIDSDSNGNLEMKLNRGHWPAFHISAQVLREISEYEANNQIKKKNKSAREQQQHEAYRYTKASTDNAKMLIESIKQRYHTMSTIMKAIIKRQNKFFMTFDEFDIQPLILEDIALDTKVDISTVSRVRNGKYALVNGTLYPLSFFFKHNKNGIDAALTIEEIKKIIESENKQSPLSDEQIAAELNKRGFNIKRRTVVKYREQAGIPTSKKRSSI